MHAIAASNDKGATKNDDEDDSILGESASSHFVTEEVDVYSDLK